MSKEITIDAVEIDGKFYTVDAYIEAVWEDDSFDHDWGGRRQTEVCGHWEAESVDITAHEDLADGQGDEVTDPELLKRLESAISDKVDSALENYDPPERDYEPQEDYHRDYD